MGKTLKQSPTKWGNNLLPAAVNRRVVGSSPTWVPFSITYRLLGGQFSKVCQILAKSFRETIGPLRFTDFANRFLIVNPCVARKLLDVRSGPWIPQFATGLPKLHLVSFLKEDESWRSIFVTHGNEKSEVHVPCAFPEVISQGSGIFRLSIS